MIRAGVAALLLHALLVAAFLLKHGGDPGWLVVVPRDLVGVPPFEAVRVGDSRDGYDGQAYYRVARAPLAFPTWPGDKPAARTLRILYPLLCYAASAGDPERLLWAMPAVNLLAVGLLGALGGRWAVRGGLSPWWGVTLPLAANVGLPLLRDLTDVVATLTLTLLVVAWAERWRPWAVLAAALLACLAREQAVGVVLLLVGVEVAARWRWSILRADRGVALALLTAAALWFGWVLVVRSQYGEWPFLPGQGNLAAPLSGLRFRLTNLAGAGGGRTSLLLHALRMAHLIGQLLLVLAVAGPVVRGTGHGAWAAWPCAALGAALAVLGGVAIYEDAWSYTRVFAPLPVGLWLLAAEKRWLAELAFLSLAALWPVAAVVKG